MKGYAFLDNDGNLGHRPASYIEEDNPGFLQDNQHTIIRVWRFDTEDTSSMYSMYSVFKNLKLKSQSVREFSSSINFDTARLSEYASSVQ
jgi:hypothetical protein